MKSRGFAPIAAALIGAAVLAIGSQVRAGGDKVVYPDGFDKGVLFTTVDRADVKQFREFYTSQAAIDAAKKGQPLPSGTVITMVQWKAKLDAQGKPEKGADGHFVKGELNGYAVMEKRTGWGAEYADNLRNGEWEYQAFTPAKAVNTAAKLNTCFECHLPKKSDDYVFLYGKMAGK